MKEFVDKLIARLEEEQEYQYQKSDEADVIEEITVKKARRKMGDCYDSAIQIVNELAEEYINTSTEHINCSTDISTDNQKLECRCKDCIHWSDMVAGATEHVKLCTVGGYMVGQNGYCVYGEKRLPAPYTEGE